MSFLIRDIYYWVKKSAFHKVYQISSSNVIIIRRRFNKKRDRDMRSLLLYTNFRLSVRVCYGNICQVLRILRCHRAMRRAWRRGRFRRFCSRRMRRMRRAWHRATHRKYHHRRYRAFCYPCLFHITRFMWLNAAFSAGPAQKVWRIWYRTFFSPGPAGSCARSHHDKPYSCRRSMLRPMRKGDMPVCFSFCCLFLSIILTKTLPNSPRNRKGIVFQRQCPYKKR